MVHAEQRRRRSQARKKFQAKICGREFGLIPLRNEGVRCRPWSLSQIAVRDPNFQRASKLAK